MVLNLVLFLLLGLAALWLALVLHTAWMLTHPPRRTYASAVARGRPGDPGELPTPREFRAWGLRTRGLELPVWDIAGMAGGPVVVMTHGWGDSRLGSLYRLDAVLPWASRVIAWDLPGHGEAPGTCALGTREREDLRALLAVIGSDRPVVLMGWSLGAGVSLAVAGECPEVCAVIAETPYRFPLTPARNVLRLRRVPWRTNLGPALALLRVLVGPGLTPEAFDRAGLAERVRTPVLVIHGDQDEVCPPDDGREIARRAPRGRLAVIAGGTHNRLWSEPGQRSACERAISEFLRDLQPLSHRASYA